MPFLYYSYNYAGISVCQFLAKISVWCNSNFREEIPTDIFSRNLLVSWVWVWGYKSLIYFVWCFVLYLVERNATIKGKPCLLYYNISSWFFERVGSLLRIFCLTWKKQRLTWHWVGTRAQKDGGKFENEALKMPGFKFFDINSFQPAATVSRLATNILQQSKSKDAFTLLNWKFATDLGGSPNW